MHPKVFVKLKKNLKTLSSGRKIPKKTKKTQKTQKKPKKTTGLGFFLNPGFFCYPAFKYLHCLCKNSTSFKSDQRFGICKDPHWFDSLDPDPDPH
jgi:hypothetical protein